MDHSEAKPRGKASGRAARQKLCLTGAGLVALLVMMPVLVPQSGHALAQDGAQEDIRDQSVGTTGAQDIVKLAEMLGSPQLFAVISQEGHDYGDSLDQGLFGGKGGPRWKASVSRIYEPGGLQARFAQELARGLQGQPQVVADAAAFFGSDTGRRILEREVTARGDLLDPDTLEAAEVAAEKLRDARGPRLKLIRSLIEAGDLIESNVASGLTGSAAFNEAMAAIQPPAQRLPEEDRMAQVWRQEAEIRANTTSWLLTFMVRAYEPLSDDDLQRFIDFSKSDSGKALNQAQFNAYSETFREVMAALGHEAGRVLLGARI